jgi:hypothetical protein
MAVASANLYANVFNNYEETRTVGSAFVNPPYRAHDEVIEHTKPLISCVYRHIQHALWAGTDWMMLMLFTPPPPLV